MSEEVLSAPKLENIPTACRRCGDISKEKDMVWIERCHNEKWLVCDHCAYVIAYCNRMIDYLREDRI